MLNTTILLVEDDADYRLLLTDYLSSLGHSVLEFDSAKAALGHIEEHSALAPDLILTDLRTAGGSGLDLAAAAKRSRPALPVIVMSAFDDRRIAGDSRRAVVDAFLAKPFRLSELERLIGSLLADAGRSADAGCDAAKPR